ncbi:hypothetical protein HYH03_006857 [Edaphochlamys debaryana]|uniref:3-beta hydroxysteroid dehydrogenase/isomerase domain-containing protein n=1 Tax=Edaphochlamys debaryana TaxID=47281 RepID=A0A836C0H7_9CHLO|nr:hypothetical protein HYH03_006857 [Edaphochlamys debaryana]|eukprot:KAG2494922.1 hypothetical protein HYH03_006857 [Edaphochlamys debaryana]
MLSLLQAQPGATSPEHATTRRALITGGCGFLGFHLATSLVVQYGIDVVLLDLAPPAVPLLPGMEFVEGSVADAAVVDKAVSSGVDAVFHVASYGMSGRELRNLRQIEAVNVGGTRHVIDACVRHGVPRLVYVSTCNVIFVGRRIDGGDETAPYPPDSAYKDAYSATKAAAEKLVLTANGTPLRPPASRAPTAAAAAETPSPDSQRRRSGAEAGPGPGSSSSSSASSAAAAAAATAAAKKRGAAAAAVGAVNAVGAGPAPPVLRTCAVRSTGIWGPGETRHQPRVIRMVRMGLFLATFGARSNLSDWIHVNNLVQLLIRAEAALRPSQAGPAGAEAARAAVPRTNAGAEAGARGGAMEPVAAGQVYYASDGAPINNFLHFKPMIEGLGYHYPSLNVPFGLVYGIAAALEVAWPLLKHVLSEPLLTRMEVDKCAVSHWFDISKARRDLGYEPAVYDRSECVRHMAAQGLAKGGKAVAGARREGDVLPTATVWRGRLLGLAMTGSVALAAAAVAYRVRSSSR